MWLLHHAINTSPVSLPYSLLPPHQELQAQPYTLLILGPSTQDKKQSTPESANEKILISELLKVRVRVGCQERLRKEEICRGYQGKCLSDKSHAEPSHSKDIKRLFTHLTLHYYFKQ